MPRSRAAPCEDGACLRDAPGAQCMLRPFHPSNQPSLSDTGVEPGSLLRRLREDPQEAIGRIAGDIGGRRSTSLGEAQAAAYLDGRMRRAGLRVSADPFCAVARDTGGRVALALVALGAVDWLAARRRWRRGLMMTRDEVRREHKEREGDPRFKAERQRLHRELAEQRMVDDVRKADFIVVNPDHLAVAVRYDPDAHDAPVVVAKGERLVAARIRQLAAEAGVPVYRDVGLARALAELPEGDEIPEALYEAVAELLRALREVESRAPSPSSSSSSSSSPSPRVPPSAWKRA